MSSNKDDVTTTKDKDDTATAIIDKKLDCFEKDFVGYKRFIINYIDNKFDEAVERAIDTVLKELRKPKPYVEVGYRG